MIVILLCVLGAAVLISSTAVTVLCVRLTRQVRQADRTPPAKEETGETAETAETAEEEQRNRDMAEGFENIMSYSVPLGHGRRTGGEP